MNFKKKIFVTTFFILFSVPAFLYIGWFLSANNFKNYVVHKMANYSRFTYQDCKITGFWDRSFKLEFSDVTFSIQPDQEFLATSDKIIIEKKIGSETLYLHPARKIELRFAENIVSCEGVKGIALDIKKTTPDYFNLTVDQKNFGCTVDGKEKFGGQVFLDITKDSPLFVHDRSIDFNFDSVINLGVDSTNKASCKFLAKWSKENLNPKIFLNLERLSFEKVGNYQIEVCGNPEIFFGSGSGFTGNLDVQVYGYGKLFDYIESILQEKYRNFFYKIIDFLKGNSNLSGHKMSLNFSGDESGVLLKDKNVIDEIASILDSA